MKNPRHPKCSRRSETCHSECKEYLEFYKSNRQADKARLDYQLAGCLLKDYMLKRARANNKVERVREI